MPNHPKGFTLIELILYVGILSILIGVLSTIFGAIIDVQLNSASTSAVDQDGRYIISKLSYDFKEATASAQPALPGNTTSSLTLQIPGNALNYTYSLDPNGNLLLVNDDGSNQLNSSDTEVSNLSFTRIGSGGDDDTIRINFTVTSRINQPSGEETQSFQTTLGFD